MNQWQVEGLPEVKLNILDDVGPILDAYRETAGKYPQYTHRRLTGIMQHFELCFEFDDQHSHFLIPAQLRDRELDIG